MIVKVRERRVDLLGTKVSVLPQQFLRGPTVMVMLRGEVQDLIARLPDARRPPPAPGGSSRLNCLPQEEHHVTSDSGGNQAEPPQEHLGVRLSK